MNRRFAFLSMVALAGCNSQPGPLTQTEYCNKYAQAVCAGVSPACLMTEATCTAGRLAECSREAQLNVGLGRDFIPPNAEPCLNEVSAAYGKLKQSAVLTASDIQAMTEACGNVYRKTGTAYSSCTADADCLDPMICDKGSCGTAKVVAQNAQCANIGELCPTGSYCSKASGVWICTDKVGLGGACGAAPCLETLRCTGTACAVQLGIGEACTVDQDCDTVFCEPYALKCALDVRFANGSAACIAMGG